MSALLTYARRWRVVARLALVLCLIALAVLSWTPGQDMQRTGLPGEVEHFIAYAITGFVAGFAGLSRVPSRDVALLWSYAAIMEIGQTLVPLREAQLSDFLFSAFGALSGRYLVLALVALTSLNAQPPSGRS